MVELNWKMKIAKTVDVDFSRKANLNFPQHLKATFHQTGYDVFFLSGSAVKLTG